MDIIVPKTLDVQENVMGYQVDKDSGLYIHNTYFKGKNTLQTELKKYLAYKIALDTTDRAVLTNKFTFEGGVAEGGAAAMDGYSGMAYEGQGDYLYIFDTDLSQGGDNATAYIEFVGFLNADATTGDIAPGAYNMVLGHDYNAGGPGPFATLFSRYSHTLSVLQGRTFYFYWRISIA